MPDRMPDPDWNRTDRVYPQTLLHEAFVEQAARTPHAPALRFREEVLTYGQLDECVGGLAERLVSLGVGPDRLVAVCMDRSLEMVVALHAILRAGGAYVPIDPEYPDERIHLMLEDLAEPVLLTQAAHIERLRTLGTRVVEVSVPGGSSSPELETPDRASSEHLAYAIYTSGSTGRPKCALNTHRGIANRIHWMQERYGLGPSDKVLQKTPFTFDVSVWEFFWPLLTGAELVVAEPGGHRDPTYLAKTIKDHGITTVHFVPSMLQVFLESPQAAECTSLRRVICSGEALPRALQDRFFATLRSAELHNLYGPTEAAVDVSSWQCDPEDPHPFVPIGKPIANVQLHILDAEMNQVPVGVTGELHIGGVQVGKGYLNRPELTAERFVADPFRAGGTLYRTGDLARYLPDGNVEFLGRSDFQVKVRGFRIELGEIESVLESFDGVRGAVVVPQTTDDGDTRLVAYVAHPSGPGLLVDDVRAHLAERLPEFMVPRALIALERLPLSPNGKIDRNSLPAPPTSRPELASAYVAPRSPLERAIATMWRGILGLDQVGIHDTFFDLGGSSLQAARFVNQVQTALNESIPIVSLFQAPTVAEYSKMLDREFSAAVARWLGPGANGGGAVGGRGSAGTGRDGGRASRPRASLASQRHRRQATRGD